MENRDKQVGLKSFIIGALLCFLIPVMAHYSIDIVHGSYLAIDFMPAGAIFLFFILVGGIAVILKLISKRIALNSSELLVIYIMMLVTSSVATMGLGAQLFPMITAPFYFATPTNRWAELIQPHIKSWMVPQGKEVIRQFYEGLPKGATIPWLAWLKPICFWLIFLMALYMIMITIMVVLRKQWVEKERLIYPLAQLPLEMVRDENNSIIRPFFKNRLMWFGFAIPFIISSINAFHHYFHFIPGIELANSIPIFRNTLDMHFRVSFPMIGYAYFINMQLAFSLWFLCLLSIVIKGICNITGFGFNENLSCYGIQSSPMLYHQQTGGMIVLVLMGLWMARDHLKDVFRKAFRGTKEIDDTNEILSYRASVFMLLVSLIVMGTWLYFSGLPLITVPVFMFFALVLFIGLTRIVAEGGLACAVAPSIAPSLAVSGLGTSIFGHGGLVSLAFTYVWGSDLRTFVMAATAHGLKIIEVIKGNRRKLFWFILGALIIGLGSTFWIVLKLAYTHGGINLQGWYFIRAPQWPYRYVVDHILRPTGVNWLGWLHTAIGGGFMLFLMSMRYRFLWWPIHPVAYPISAVWMMEYMWFSIFIAWIIKALLLRYGGNKIYKGAKPFFLGLILGQLVAAGLWFIIDLITGHTGNVVFWA
ncbi:MAG: hypothetical protein HQ541_19155 [Mariniphaga sp.]|nr:hypothetical protein [Mariniphaga sp.]